MDLQHPTARGRRAARSAIVTAVAATALAVLTLAPGTALAEAHGSDYAVLVRGELSTEDIEEAQLAHDAVAAGGEEAARSAGDTYHLAGLSTALLGGSEGSFLGIDQWADAEGIEAFYADPAVAEGFGALFASEPTVEVFARQADWHSWGELPVPGAGEQRWIAVVRGRLSEADPTIAQQGHDAVASGAQALAEEAGDIAHVAFTGLADPQEFLAIDVWAQEDGIEAVYGDPAFQEAFATLFEAPPTLTIYTSTDWYQWP